MQSIKHFTDINDAIYASVSINTETGLLMNMWRGEVLHSGQVSDVVEFCCAQINEHQLKSWLSDVTSLEGPFQVFSAEAQKGVMNCVSSTNLQSFALVSQRSANPARSALLHLMAQLQIEVRTFDCFSQAIEWLLLPAMEDEVWEQAQSNVY